jgi:putative hydrolase of the HAD superfamily
VEWNRKIMYESHHHALGTIRDPYESVRIIAHAIDPDIPEETIRAAVEARPRRFRHALLQVRPEVLRALARIRELTFKLGLISNAGLDEVGAWPESPLAPFFDGAFFSCHEGLMKPDPAFYRLAAARLGVVPERCVFVGDGGSQEHEGAKAVGMRTVLILGLLEESLPALAAQRPRNTDFVIKTMEELVGILESI